ncbi:PHP domain-containing protein [Anaerobacillus alkaliphilus]|uniref:PHP domain-containing protein n=1 Tax=Anaerobacillus alkaliphilus TaxID=1548597 RepID=A0A4Q0VP85_9BACI|nr:PHP domain-containing protein [Anaerobacillus alkaliphilus]RXI97861.1 PHP domain-containing protein [Anaerobacillus alkaliphilus]
MKNADLHMHTTASDGGYSPRELVKKCHEVGLQYIAITDHDTVGGVRTAIQEGEKLGLTVIPGIEFSTKENGVSVHVLGFGIDIEDESLLSMLDEQQRMRKLRMEEMVGKFESLNIRVKEADILKEADGGSIGRPHVAKVLVKAGVVKDVAEAFQLYLGEGKPCYVKKQREMTPVEAMEWIKKSNGVAVVAHPVYYELDDKIEEWVATGLLHGVEVYHRDHDQATQLHYERLVQEIERKLNISLLRTGGSDFHHEDYGRVRQPLGETRIENDLAIQLLERINTPRT